MIKLPVFFLTSFFFPIFITLQPPLCLPGTPPAIAGTNPSLQLPFPEGFSRSGPVSLPPRMSCFAHAHWQFQQIEEEAKRANFPQNFVRSGSSYSAVALKQEERSLLICTIIV